MPTKITLTGWKEFDAKLKNMSTTIMKEVDGEVEEASRNWAVLAKNDAPKNVGLLAGGIANKKTAQAVWEVTSNQNYSPYMEWGTKSKVKVSADLQTYAAQFKGGGGKSIGDVKAMIYEWCKRKGIPKEAWWPIYISIMVKGVTPHPFFFIQMPAVEKKLRANIQKNILNHDH